MSYTRAAAIGAISGLRLMSGPAVVAQAGRRKLVDLRDTPLAWLGSDNAVRTSAVLAAGELIADKLPGIPDRTAPASLLFRAISGAACGYSMCVSRDKEQRALSALIGATAAVATSWIGFQYRKRAPLPSLIAALLEDAVTLSAGGAVIDALSCDAIGRKVAL